MKHITNTKARDRRHPPSRPGRSGFTLIEVLVALAIIAILATLAMPSYQQQIRQARRADGQTALLRLAVAQERFRANCPKYADQVDGAAVCDPDASSSLGLSPLSPDGHYRLRLSEVSASGFKAHADPIGGQSSDQAGGVACRPLTIDQDGQREPRACW